MGNLYAFTETIFRSTVHLTITNEEEYIKKFLEPLRNSKQLNKCVVDALAYAYSNLADFVQQSSIELDGLDAWKRTTDASRQYRILRNMLADLKVKSEQAITTGDTGELYRVLGYIATINLGDGAENTIKLNEDSVHNTDDKSLLSRLDNLSIQIDDLRNIVTTLVNSDVLTTKKPDGVNNPTVETVDTLNDIVQELDVESVDTVEDTEQGSIKLGVSTIEPSIAIYDTIETRGDKKEVNPAKEKQEIDLVPLKQKTTEVVDLSDDFSSDNGDNSDLLDTIKSFGLM